MLILLERDSLSKKFSSSSWKRSPPGQKRGSEQYPDGMKIADEVDAKTGVPILSLYKAEDGRPTPEMLKDVDVLVYDLQEVGGRTWTYVSTMALAMQAAAEKKIPFVVLDRCRAARPAPR